MPNPKASTVLTTLLATLSLWHAASSPTEAAPPTPPKAPAVHPTGKSQPSSRPQRSASLSAAAREQALDAQVDDLLGRMTLEEKVGQMTLFTGDYDVTGPSVRKEYMTDIARGRVGSVFNVMTPEFTRKLQKLAVEKTRLHIPLLFGYDVIHGHHTTFPIPLAESCSWDLRVMERSAHIAAVEASADGLHWTFAPMVDIARDPRWGRIAEGAGEDPWLGSAIARARVRGFQGPDLTAPDSILACVKHYAAYGAAQAGRDYNTVDLSRRSLYESYLPPYKAAIDAGVATVMTSFNELDGVPASANPFLLDEVLRKQWGFKGFVVTDYTSINEMVAHGSSLDLRDAAAQAAVAGVDMDMQGAAYMTHLPALVRAGKVPLAAVDQAVRHILRIKFAKGLFADPYRACSPQRRQATMRPPAHLAAARDAAKRSIVLLKNEGSVLPLKAAGLRVALVGPLAADRGNMLGTWAGQGQADKAVSLRDALLERTGVTTTYARGCDFDGKERSGFAEALKAARNSDVVLAVMGEPTNFSGEASSRANPDLPAIQRDLLKELHATGKPVVLVLANGRPLTVTWEQQNLPAIVEAWHLGSEAGNAMTDVLFGDYNPAGRLVTTFPRSVGQIPLYYNHKNTGRPYDPANHFTSCYIDESNEPLYPFGFGLSYTTFAYSPLTLAKKRVGLSDTQQVDVTIRNTGTRDGEEVAQLYIAQRVSGLTRPVRELRGFRKIFLKAGEARTLQFKLRPEDLRLLRRDMTFGNEPCSVRVWVAPSSMGGSSADYEVVARR